jgi:hypothetical protein
MNSLNRRSFASKAFAGIAAFGVVSRLNQPAEAQLVMEHIGMETRYL